MKYSFEEPYIWSQYGLSFLAAGVNSRKSYKTLIEASQLNIKPTALLLLAAKQALNQLQVIFRSPSDDFISFVRNFTSLSVLDRGSDDNHTKG